MYMNSNEFDFIAFALSESTPIIDGTGWSAQHYPNYPLDDFSRGRLTAWVITVNGMADQLSRECPTFKREPFVERCMRNRWWCDRCTLFVNKLGRLEWEDKVWIRPEPQTAHATKED
jgi:hypothetical protein